MQFRIMATLTKGNLNETTFNETQKVNPFKEKFSVSYDYENVLAMCVQ